MTPDELNEILESAKLGEFCGHEWSKNNGGNWPRCVLCDQRYDQDLTRCVVADKERFICMGDACKAILAPCARIEELGADNERLRNDPWICGCCGCCSGCGRLYKDGHVCENGIKDNK